MRTTAFLLAISFWMTSASSAQVKDAEELQRALQLYDSGNYAEALELYRKLIEVESNHPALLYEAGLTAKALGDLKACIAYVTDAVATKRGLLSSLALLGSRLHIHLPIFRLRFRREVTTRRWRSIRW